VSVDWEMYQKCPVCAAGLGEPCAALLAVIVGCTPLKTEATRPHSTRKLRAAAARAGGSHG